VVLKLPVCYVLA